MSNVVIKNQVQAYNIDAFNRTVVCDEDIENGCVFKLEEYSNNEDEEMVWKTAKPSASDKGLWMAASPEVVVTRGADGNLYKGLTPDPRAFINYKGMMIDAIYLAVGDIIEMTAEGLEAETNAYLVPTSEYKLGVSSSKGAGLALKKIGKSVLHIGQGGIAKQNIPTYKYVVEAN